MADETNTPTVDTEKYAGPSKAASTAGHSYIYGGMVGLAGIIGGAVAGAKMLKADGKFVTSLGRALQELNIKSITPKTAAVGLAAMSAGFIGDAIGESIGAFRGSKKYDEGQKQFEALKEQRNTALAQVDAKQKQIEGLQGEVATHHEERKKFSEHMASRAEHGSHAAAHEAATAHAEHAEAAR